MSGSPSFNSIATTATGRSSPLPETSNIRRYPNISRQQHQTATRTAYRERTKKRDAPESTPAEVAAKAQRQKEAKEQHQKALEAANAEVWAVAEKLSADLCDHPPKYYYQQLLQQSKSADSSQGVNLWNAYLSKETKLLNAEKADQGKMRERSGNYSATLSEKWKSMTQEQKIEYTKDDVEKLTERRENQKFAPHNVSISCFHDSRTSLEKIERELKALHERTGMHVLMGCVRGDQGDFMAPHIWTTDEKLEDFQLTLGMEFGQFVGKLESFVIAGLPGAKKSAVQDLLDMKTRISNLILNALQEAAKPYVTNKMNYESFNTAITHKLGLVIENWPLPVFQAPGKFNSMAELKTLYNAWKSGHAHFRRLSHDELERREKENFAPPLLDASEIETAAPATPSADISRTYENAFPVADAPERPAKKPRKDKGAKRGPNARTKNRAAQAASTPGQD
ncbi:uncharacterized protein PHACADRAFT_201921 [Phanerochaete carnosa HHB-10118-sp]|uniref:Uncharacterized protein n=1 Tax=Phanerochaete carnosa (strain HHB-10118-sp) TaxID=650164 RepID=K5VRH7_PHACS|nr:uncharacterized protein PHACADRAFT_201921 [Phanerochaete carnosa HHB-10118-sp]EKM49189.1 hypothetical protein PHACADRAFT_201921 [Phanerochaete carnosa HHB-10118-sp]